MKGTYSTFLLLITVSLSNTQGTDNEGAVCPSGRTPIDCDLRDEDNCADAICAYYHGALCEMDPCNNCEPVFYDEETNTKLRCNREPLLCASCFTQDGTACGGPGEPTETQVCEEYQVCGVYSVEFTFGPVTLPIFYRGCLPSDRLNDGDASCYRNTSTLFDHLEQIVRDANDIQSGHGCICTEDHCNNFDLDSYEREEIASCVDEFAIWFNPGDFRPNSDCHASFCTNDGTFACRFEAIGCEFEEFSYDHNERFRSGYGDCICDDGDIVCTSGEIGNRLICFTTASQLRPGVGGIEICEENDVCLYGYTGFLVFGTPVEAYRKGCVDRTLLDFSGNCTTEYDDVSSLLAGDSSTRVNLCKCETKYCNEIEPGTSAIPVGVSCTFKGNNLQHGDEFLPDECNVCKCYNGETFCTEYACNGLQCYSCYESAVDGLGDCAITFCQEGEVCVSYSLEIFGFIADYSFNQGCVNSQDIPLDVCLTEERDAVVLGIIQPEITEIFGVNSAISMCNETLCNTMANWESTCHTPTDSPTEPPTSKICYDENDPSVEYMEGEVAVFGCRSCECGGRLSFGIWSCIDICASTISPPTPETGGACSFGLSYPRYEHGVEFPSGCGSCVCNDDEIVCSRGECPDLFCAVGRGKHADFCEADSLCVTSETIFFGALIEERNCISAANWPYSNTSTQDPEFFGGEPGTAFVCSWNACNTIPNPQDQPTMCTYGEFLYGHREEFAVDECNQCTCVHGTVYCTREPCNGPRCEDYHSGEPFIERATTNSTCLYDQVCVSVLATSFNGDTLEHGGCFPRNTAPPPGECTNNLPNVTVFFISPLSSGSVCTVLEAQPTTMPPTMPPTTTTMPPSMPPTMPPVTNFCEFVGGESLQVDDIINTDYCTCECQRGSKAPPVLSCECEFDVKIVFKKDFDVVRDSLTQFKQVIIEQLAIDFEVPIQNIKHIKVYEGSIVVEAKITSDSVEIDGRIQEVVEDGSFAITLNGVDLRAESLEVTTEAPTAEAPTEDNSFRTLIITIASIIGALAIVVAVVAVCFVCSGKKCVRKPESFESFRGNYPDISRPNLDTQQSQDPETHEYTVPPIEVDEAIGKESDPAHRGVQNAYQSSLEFNDSTDDSNYHKSLDFNEPEGDPPSYFAVMEIDNLAYDENAK